MRAAVAPVLSFIDGSLLQFRPFNAIAQIKRIYRPSRSLQLICKDMDFMIRFRCEASDGGNHGCEGDFGKEVCCAAER